MDYKNIQKIYDETLDEFVAFADKADYLSEKPKQQFLNYKLKMFNQRIELEHKREAFLRKASNKLYKSTLKEMKRELKLKAKNNRRELAKLAVMTKLRGENEIYLEDENTTCTTCGNCVFDDQNICLHCNAYNLSFTSEEMSVQFCKCFCKSYTAYIPPETGNDDAIDEETKEEEKINPPENITPDDTTEETSEQDDFPNCCCECKYFQNNDDGDYCDKHNVYLDGDIENICCCECAGFLSEEEEE